MESISIVRRAVESIEQQRDLERVYDSASRPKQWGAMRLNAVGLGQGSMRNNHKLLCQSRCSPGLQTQQIPRYCVIGSPIDRGQ